MELYIKVIFLACVQGVTEFLPVSSSGNLAVFENLLGIHSESALTLTIVLHAGTLLAIIIFYLKTIIWVLKKKNWIVIFYIILGSIPAGIVGIALKKSGAADLFFSNLIVPGIGLLITGSFLMFIFKKRETGKTLKEITPINAIIIGIFQAIAIVPGISRSGSTISAATMQKIEQKEAATFSFLLAIPAIGGAAFLELISCLKKGNTSPEAISSQILLVGFIISAIVGYFSLILLIKSLKKGTLRPYSYYCFCLGAFALLKGIFF